ncbi:MAG: hypothetical protein QW478_15870 [Candidatus Micrarchaeaceae archaeon]
MITRKDLLREIEYLNQFNGDKEFPYKLSGAYGKVWLSKVVNKDGAAEFVTIGMTKRELFWVISAMTYAIGEYKKFNEVKK